MESPTNYAVYIRTTHDTGGILYCARVTELPDICVYGRTFDEAYNGAMEIIKTTQQIFAEKGKAFPASLKVQEE